MTNVLIILIISAVLIHGWSYLRSRKRVDLEELNRLRQKVHGYSNHELICRYHALADKDKKLSSYEDLILTILENEMIIRDLLPKQIREI